MPGTNYCLPLSMEAQNEIFSLVGKAFGRKCLNIVDNGRQTMYNDDGGTDAGALVYYKSHRKAMNRNWSNQKANPALKTKTVNK